MVEFCPLSENVWDFASPGFGKSSWKHSKSFRIFLPNQKLAWVLWKEWKQSRHQIRQGRDFGTPDLERGIHTGYWNLLNFYPPSPRMAPDYSYIEVRSTVQETGYLSYSFKISMYIIKSSRILESYRDSRTFNSLLRNATSSVAWQRRARTGLKTLGTRVIFSRHFFRSLGNLVNFVSIWPTKNNLTDWCIKLD